MRNSKKNKILRAGAILALSMTLLIGSSMSAFAFSGEDGETSGVTVEETIDNEPEETETAETDDTESEETESEETEETTGGSLTPDGNLTLVDDLSEEDSEAMEFITVTTKSGNYFYLIIDRSSNEENVYFLNLVDESDLMALMDEEEQEAYSQTTEITETEETDTATEEVSAEEEAETDMDTETEETQEESGAGVPSSILMLIVLVVIGGAVAGGYYFLKIKPGKNGSSIDEDMEFYDDEEYENEDEEGEEIEFVDLDAEDFDDAEDEE